MQHIRQKRLLLIHKKLSYRRCWYKYTGVRDGRKDRQQNIATPHRAHTLHVRCAIKKTAPAVKAVVKCRLPMFAGRFLLSVHVKVHFSLVLLSFVRVLSGHVMCRVSWRTDRRGRLGPVVGICRRPTGRRCRCPGHRRSIGGRHGGRVTGRGTPCRPPIDRR